MASDPIMKPRKKREPFVNVWFFPAAALYATVLLPISVLTMLGWLPPLPGLSSPLGHAHEMLFGFALAVVAGYLLGPQPVSITLCLLASWVVARMGFLIAPGGWMATIGSVFFAGGLVWRIVPRFAGAAIKWRNRIIAPVVVALAVASVLAVAGFTSVLTVLLLRETMILLSVLLFFMGGRIIAPSIAGYATRTGWKLTARVQPRLEGLGLILLLLAIFLKGLPWSVMTRAAGLVLIGAGVLVVVRLLRWQPWRCLARPDLAVLLLGYGWLAVGLVLLGLSWATSRLPPSVALHALTVGALGSLTFAVMARTRLMQRWRDANARPWIHPFALLISAAALLRTVPPLFDVWQPAWLLMAATCWSLAFAALCVLLFQTLGPASGRV